MPLAQNSHFKMFTNLSTFISSNSLHCDSSYLRIGIKIENPKPYEGAERRSSEFLEWKKCVLQTCNVCPTFRWHFENTGNHSLRSDKGKKKYNEKDTHISGDHSWGAEDLVCRSDILVPLHHRPNHSRQILLPRKVHLRLQPRLHHERPRAHHRSSYLWPNQIFVGWWKVNTNILNALSHLFISRFVKNERLVPFGHGRRYCMGEILARNEIFIFTVDLLQSRKFLPPRHSPSPDARNYLSNFSRIPDDFHMQVVQVWTIVY